MTLRTHKKHIGWLIAEVIVQPGELAQGSSALQIRYGLASFSAWAMKYLRERQRHSRSAVRKLSPVHVQHRPSLLS